MKEEKQKIHVLMILEIIGKPPQYLIATLEEIIRQMGTEEGVVVKSKEIKEPKKMEESSGIASKSKEGIKIEEKDFYVSFAEIEIEVENLLNLALLMFKYMPAHVEILSPENIPISNTGLNDILNDLIRRLHAYDEVARVLQVEKAILESKLSNIILEKKEEKKEKRVKTKKKK
jgi:hypothetical protein